VEELSLHLIGSTLTEKYTRKWGKIQFDEKVLADAAWNNTSAFSAAGTSSVRVPVYKHLSFSVSTIDNFLNNPQVGYKKNSFQFSTGFALNLH
jgi:heme-binding NEAT domain protein